MDHLLGLTINWRIHSAVLDMRLKMHFGLMQQHSSFYIWKICMSIAESAYTPRASWIQIGHVDLVTSICRLAPALGSQSTILPCETHPDILSKTK